MGGEEQTVGRRVRVAVLAGEMCRVARRIGRPGRGRGRTQTADESGGARGVGEALIRVALAL